MKKLLQNNFNIVFTSVIVYLFAYYLLVKDTFLHTSIASIIHESRNLEIKSHLLVLGLLPIYIATVIFGAAMLGSYLGSTFLQFLWRK